MTRQETKKVSLVHSRGTVHALVLLNVGTFALGTVLQHVMIRTGTDDARMRILSVVFGLVAFAGLLTASTRKTLLDVTASTLFASVSLVTLTFFSILGTVVLQGQPEQLYRDEYGAMAPMILGLFLDDVFHSLGFTGVVGLTAGSLVATLFLVRKWTLRRIGLVGSHIGCVIILVGAAVGSIWGVKGRIKMRVDQVVESFVAEGPDGQPVEVPLGFSVRLDQFDLLHYEPAFRLRIFEILEEEEKLVASFDPASPAAAAEIARYGATLNNYWPDHSMKLEVTPAAEGAQGVAALLVDPAGGAPHGQDLWLFDEGTGQAEYMNVTETASLGFVWKTQRASRLVEGLAQEQAAGSPHVIEHEGRKIPVQVGKTYPLPGTDLSVEVLAAFKDFVIDPQTKTPQERSGQPNNPALQVRIADASGATLEKKWLFANFPSFGHGEQQQGPQLVYAYSAVAPPFTRGVLVVGEASEAWTIEDGAVASRTPIRQGATLDVGGVTFEVARMLGSASARYVHFSVSDEALKPVAELLVAGEDQPRFIGSGQAVQLPGDLVLALTPKGDDVRDFISTLTVLDEGREVLTEKVEVNHPLKYAGFALYQSEYDPRDPTFSGFEVVRDPGLWLVYLGFILLIAAVAHVILGVPLINRIRRRLTAAGEGGR